MKLILCMKDKKQVVISEVEEYVHEIENKRIFCDFYSGEREMYNVAYATDIIVKGESDE